MKWLRGIGSCTHHAPSEGMRAWQGQASHADNRSPRAHHSYQYPCPYLLQRLRRPLLLPPGGGRRASSLRSQLAVGRLCSHPRPDTCYRVDSLHRWEWPWTPSVSPIVSSSPEAPTSPWTAALPPEPVRSVVSPIVQVARRSHRAALQPPKVLLPIESHQRLECKAQGQMLPVKQCVRLNYLRSLGLV